MERVLIHGRQCSRYAEIKMPRPVFIQSTPPPPVDTDQTVAALLLIFVVIVLTSGVLALFLIVRARLRRDIPKVTKHKQELPNAWEESGRRMQIPPRDEDDPDDENDDDDDDDDGEPTPPVPISPETSVSV